MSQPAFDTYKAVKTLSDAEPGEPLAEAIVDTIGAAVENVAMENVATKDDIKQVQGDIKHLQGDINRLQKDKRLQKDAGGRFDNRDGRIDNVNDSIDVNYSIGNQNKRLVDWWFPTVMVFTVIVTVYVYAVIVTTMHGVGLNTVIRHMLNMP